MALVCNVYPSNTTVLGVYPQRIVASFFVLLDHHYPCSSTRTFAERREMSLRQLL